MKHDGFLLYPHMLFIVGIEIGKVSQDHLPLASGNQEAATLAGFWLRVGRFGHPYRSFPTGGRSGPLASGSGAGGSGSSFHQR